MRASCSDRQFHTLGTGNNMQSKLLLAIAMLVSVWPLSLKAEPPLNTENILSLDGAVETLRQDFKEAPEWRQGGTQVYASPKPLTDPDFSWTAGYIWNHPPLGARAPWPQPKRNFPAWTSNGNANADPNGDMIKKIGPSRSPLIWDKTLRLIARPMPEDLALTIDKPDPRDYLSASITSFPYSQQYGVFAMSAKLPIGNGIWPAFWLLPVDKSWPPELDVMEVIGREPTKLYTTIHIGKGRPAIGKGTDVKIDLSADFHEYAVDWGPETIKWYFDRKLVFTQPTPPEFHKPFYILANLAVGKPENWGGAPDKTTKFPATMEIAYIRAWQRPGYIKP